MKQTILYARRADNRCQTLKEHCEAVAEAASRTGERVGLPSLFRLCGLLHDMGKASAAFQTYLQQNDPSLRGTVAHAPQGAVYALRRWGRAGNPAVAMVATAIASHHGRLPDLINEKGDDFLSCTLPDTRFDDLDTIAAGFIAQVAAEEQLDALYQSACSEFKAYIDGLLQSCKDIGADDRQTAIHNLMGLTQRALFGALIDADRWDAYCFEAAGADEAAPAPWDDWARRLETKLHGFSIRHTIDRLRARIADECLACASQGPGVYRLNVPTGAGKTFSSLRFALAAVQQTGMERIIYAAPYKSILEQTARVFRETLGHETRILEHHSDVTVDQDNDSEAYSRYQTLSERWNAPLILTTTVQLLDTLFAGRSASVRRFPSLSRYAVCNLPGAMAGNDEKHGCLDHIRIVLRAIQECHSSVFQGHEENTRCFAGGGHSGFLHKAAGACQRQHGHPLPCHHSQGAQVCRENRSDTT